MSNVVRPVVRSVVRSAVRAALHSYAGGEPVETAAYIRTLTNESDIDEGVGAGAATHSKTWVSGATATTRGYMDSANDLYLWDRDDDWLHPEYGAMILPGIQQFIGHNNHVSDFKTARWQGANIDEEDDAPGLPNIISADDGDCAGSILWPASVGSTRGMYSSGTVNTGHPDNCEMWYVWVLKHHGHPDYLQLRVRDNTGAGYVHIATVDPNDMANPPYIGNTGSAVVDKSIIEHLGDDYWMYALRKADCRTGGGIHRMEIMFSDAVNGTPNASATGSATSGWELAGEWQMRDGTLADPDNDVPYLLGIMSGQDGSNIIQDVGDVSMALAYSPSDTEGVISFDYYPHGSYHANETYDRALLTRNVAGSAGWIDVEDNAGESFIRFTDGTNTISAGFARVADRKVHVRVRWNTTESLIGLSIDDGEEVTGTYDGAMPNVDGSFTLGNDARGMACCSIKNFRHWTTDWIQAA